MGWMLLALFAVPLLGLYYIVLITLRARSQVLREKEEERQRRALDRLGAKRVLIENQHGVYISLYSSDRQ